MMAGYQPAISLLTGCSPTGRRARSVATLPLSPHGVRLGSAQEPEPLIQLLVGIGPQNAAGVFEEPADYDEQIRGGLQPSERVGVPVQRGLWDRLIEDPRDPVLKINRHEAMLLL